MIEHTQDIIPLLLWMIVGTGGALLALLVWIGKRTDKKIEEIPKNVSIQVAKVHDEIVKQMETMNETHKGLERDVRDQITGIDRRLVRVEVRCDMQHMRGVD